MQLAAFINFLALFAAIGISPVDVNVNRILVIIDEDKS